MGPLAAPPSPSLSGVAWGWRCLKGLVAMATIGFRGRHLVPPSANRRWEPELQPRVTLLPPSHTVAKSRDPLPGVSESAQTDSQAHHGGPRDGGAQGGTRSQAGEVSWAGGRTDGRTGGNAPCWPLFLSLPSAHSALYSLTHTHTHSQPHPGTLSPNVPRKGHRKRDKGNSTRQMNPPHHGPENYSNKSFTSDFTWKRHQRPPTDWALGITA